MTILLTLAVYSVRISSDFPTQSLYLPYVSVYFTIGYLHTFSTLLWLCVQSYMIERKIMFWWVFYIAYFQSKIDLFFTILVRLFKSLKKTKKQEPKVGLDPVPMKQVCNKCDMCINCLKDKNKAKASDDSFKVKKFVRFVNGMWSPGLGRPRREAARKILNSFKESLYVSW